MAIAIIIITSFTSAVGRDNGAVEEDIICVVRVVNARKYCLDMVVMQTTK